MQVRMLLPIEGTRHTIVSLRTYLQSIHISRLYIRFSFLVHIGVLPSFFLSGNLRNYLTKHILYAVYLCRCFSPPVLHFCFICSNFCPETLTQSAGGQLPIALQLQKELPQGDGRTYHRHQAGQGLRSAGPSRSNFFVLTPLLKTECREPSFTVQSYDIGENM